MEKHFLSSNFRQLYTMATIYLEHLLLSRTVCGLFLHMCDAVPVVANLALVPTVGG